MKQLQAWTATSPDLAKQKSKALGSYRDKTVRLSLAFLVAASCLMAQRAPVNLGTAGDFVVLAKTGITNVSPSPIVGNIGASPITGAAVLVSCAEVTGTITVVDAAGPAPCSIINPAGLGVAIGNMQTAYADAAGRTVPDFTELGGGNISGRTLTPGLYKWSTGVLVDSTGFTLSGGPNAVWIFQVAGDLTLANGARVTLAGGARANNIFWQVAGPTGATLGTGTRFSGTILSSKQVIMNTGAGLNGRALAETQVTLQSTSITTPGILVGGVPVPVAPTVTSTVPVNLSSGVPIGNLVTATFSGNMDPTTITPLTLTVKAGLTTVAGTVSYLGLTATFTPTSNLVPNTLYTGTITTGAKDTSGVALTANYVWTFTTAAILDVTPPTVSSTAPTPGSTGVPVGNTLAATFSEAMNPATITAATFTLQQGATPVSGTVLYGGLTGTFTPTAALTANTLYTATITNGVRDLAGNNLAINYAWTFTTGGGPDVTPPTVSSTVPTAGATGVSVSNALSATFSETMNPATVNTATFTLRQGLTPIAGTVNYVGLTGTFTPSVSLAASTTYTANISTGARDLAGNALVSDYTWSFATGLTPDTTAPTVPSSLPASGATNVPTGNALTVTFSEPLDPTTVTTATFSLRQGGTIIPGTVSYVGLTATFRPLAVLAANSLFVATVTTGVRDLAGNALTSDYTWTFTTGSVPDTTSPFVTSAVPANAATLVSTATNIVVNFSEPMDPLTISTATFTLRAGQNAIAGTVTYSGTAATFRSAFNLLPNTIYDALVSSGARDLAGNPLANYAWTFATGTATGQTPVCLSSFAVLSGSGVINTGTSVVTGDIGVSPGTSISGFPPGTIRGVTHLGDAAAAQGMADLNASYTEATSRTSGAVTVSGDIGGQTFTPGLYKSTSSLSISTGQVILDGKGDQNSVFVFQIATALTTTVGRQILLVGGAKPGNVYWVVGGSATLGDSSAFKGSILANQSITVNPGATVDGRLLARNGTVTLQSNVITSPAPGIVVGGIYNSANTTRTMAAGSIATVFGYNLASSTVSATSYPLVTLGGTTAQVGNSVSSLFMVSCSQVNVQVPWELAGQTEAPFTITTGGQTSAPEMGTLAPFAPGIYSLNQLGSGQGAVQIAPTALLAAATDAAGNRPVKKGEYIAIFATGLGPVSNRPATGTPALAQPLSSTLTLPIVTLGDATAQVTFSGLVPGLSGLYQINVLVPPGAPSGNNVAVNLSIGGVAANVVTIAIQ